MKKNYCILILASLFQVIIIYLWNICFPSSSYVFYADPVSLLFVGLTVAGGISQAMAVREEGKQAKKLAEYRAAIAQKEAEDVKRQAAEEAKIEEEKRIRLLAAQKAGYAAGNVRLDIGAPLLVETETSAAAKKDIGYILETGRERAESLRMQAGYELAYGKARKRQSRWSALSALLGTGAKAGMMGYRAGWFS